MGRYRKVSAQMYGDERFVRLSPQRPSGQALWIHLLIGPCTTNLPGLIVRGEAALAEELWWRLADFRRCWREIERLGMAQADWAARVVWMPNAIRHNPPDNPNVIRGWRENFNLVPPSKLKAQAIAVWAAYVAGLGVGLQQAFRETFPEASVERLAEPFPEPLPQPSAKGSRKQEQEQEQEQEPDQEQEGKGEGPSAPVHAAPAGNGRDRPGIPVDLDIPYEQIIGLLNAEAGTDFRATTAAHRELIRARWREGYLLGDFQRVIRTKVAEWKDDPKMCQYLRPATLFNKEKFSNYVGQLGPVRPVHPVDAQVQRLLQGGGGGESR